MYSLSEEDRQNILFSLSKISVTGPDQGALLYNAANIIRNLPKMEEKEGET
jgi:hypothetical protein